MERSSRKATAFRFTEPMRDPKEFLENAIDFVSEIVSHDEKVICALSGGVDSSTTAEILRRAIGDNLYPLHFDTGFMRRIRGKEECDLVRKNFERFKNFEFVDRKKVFYENVFGIKDAEEKRRAFRRTYELVLNKKIEEIKADAVAQGTIKPDIIETEGGIKSQNNVGTNFSVDKLVEPLANLYKPDVRLLARELGFSKKTYLKQPFPGPGLSLRSVEAIDGEKLENEKVANDLVEKFVERYFQENYGKTVLWDETTGFRTPFQYFAGTFDGVKKERKKVSEYLRGLGLKAKAFTLENKVTGVMEEDGGRKRSYSSPVLLEGGLEQEMVFFLGKKIPELFKTSRVLFKLSEAREHESSKWLVSIRAVSSKDASYADPLQIPLEELERWGDEIIAKTNTRVVAYDVTPKPPATIEYE